MGTVRKDEMITAAEALSFLTLLLRFDYLRLWISSTKTPPIIEYLHKEYIKENARVSETWFRSIMENLRKSIRTDKGHRNYFLDLIQYRPFIHFTNWIHKTTPGDQVEVEVDVAWKIRNGHCFSRNINWEAFCKEWKEPRHAQGIDDEEREEKKPKEAMNGDKGVQKEEIEKQGIDKTVKLEKTTGGGKEEMAGKKEPKTEPVDKEENKNAMTGNDGDKTVKLEKTTGGGKEEMAGTKEPKTEPVDKEENKNAMTGKHTKNKESAGSEGKKNLKEEKEATEESRENKKRAEGKQTIPNEERDATAGKKNEDKDGKQEEKRQKKKKGEKSEDRPKMGIYAGRLRPRK